MIGRLSGSKKALQVKQIRSVMTNTRENAIEGPLLRNLPLPLGTDWDPKSDHKLSKCVPEAFPKRGSKKTLKNGPQSDPKSEVSNISNVAKTW